MPDFFLSVSDGVILGFFALVLLFLAYLGYRSDLRGLGAYLLALRVAVLVLVVVLLMAPILALRIQTHRNPLVAVLVDTSESMRLIDGDHNRNKVALEVLNNPALQALSKRTRVEFFQFADGLQPINNTGDLTWNGRATDIAKALDVLREQTKGNGLALAVLISDGGQNRGGQPERAAAELNVPVLVVGIGDPMAQKDVAISSAVVDPLGYMGRPLILQVRVRTTGFDQGHALLRVATNGREIAEKNMVLLEGEQIHDFELNPDRPGRYAYEISVAPQPGERTVENNRMLVSTEVLESRLRLLVLSGSPSADLAYLLRVLRADPNLDLQVFIRQQPTGWTKEVQTAFADLNRQDAVVLINVPQAELAGKPEQDLVVYVKKGGALLAIGGDAAFDARYAMSPLSDVLPLRFEKLGRTLVDASFGVELPESRHPIMRISSDPLADREAWAALPPLLSYNRISGVADQATVLIRHDLERLNGQPMPLVAVMRVGPGKTMAVAFHSFWRYGLMMWGIGKNDALSQAFWKNAVRWLVTRDEMSRVRVTTEQSTYRSGEDVVVYAQVFDPLMQPMTDAQVKAVVQDSNGVREVILRDGGDGRYSGRLGGFPQGDYACVVHAVTRDGLMEEGIGHFTVGRYSLEYETVRMDAELLREIASHSGGQFVLPKGVTEALTHWELMPEPVVENYKLRLWGHRWPLFVLVGLLALEWIVRRRRGMI